MTDDEWARKYVERWIEFEPGQDRSERQATAELSDALRQARVEGARAMRERAAEFAGCHVCRLTRLPCDGTAIEGDECVCRVSSRIAKGIRAIDPEEVQ